MAVMPYPERPGHHTIPEGVKEMDQPLTQLHMKCEFLQ